MEMVSLEGEVKGGTEIHHHQKGVKKVRSIFPFLVLFLGSLNMPEDLDGVESQEGRKGCRRQTHGFPCTEMVFWP